MPNYKIVDVDKLDTDLSTIAETIRTNNSTTETLEFPQGYIDGVNDIPEDYLAKVYNRECTELVNHKMKGALYNNFQTNNAKLTKVYLPMITTLEASCFHECNYLTDVNLPSVTTISSQSFSGCRRLKKLYLPSLTNISGWGYTIQQCIYLKTVYFPNFTGTITTYSFTGCRALKTLILGADTVCTLANKSAFSNTPIAGYTDFTYGELGYIYVKKALVEEYKAATNWSAYASQIRAIEDYPEVLNDFLTQITFTIRLGYDLETAEEITVTDTVMGGTTWGEWLTANGYADWINEYGYITNDGNFFLGGNGTVFMATDIITAGTFGFSY